MNSDVPAVKTEKKSDVTKLERKSEEMPPACHTKCVGNQTEENNKTEKTVAQKKDELMKEMTREFIQKIKKINEGYDPITRKPIRRNPMTIEELLHGPVG